MIEHGVLNAPPGEPAEGSYPYRIDALRRFARFVFRRFGPMRRRPLVSGLDRYEFRVYVEIGRSEYGTTARWMAWELGMDPSRISRLLARFRAHGFIRETPEEYDNRVKRIEFTDRGRHLYRSLNRLSEQAAQRELNRMGEGDQRRLVAAMETIEALMGNSEPLRRL